MNPQEPQQPQIPKSYQDTPATNPLPPAPIANPAPTISNTPQQPPTGVDNEPIPDLEDVPEEFRADYAKMVMDGRAREREKALHPSAWNKFTNKYYTLKFVSLFFVISLALTVGMTIYANKFHGDTSFKEVTVSVSVDYVSNCQRSSQNGTRCDEILVGVVKGSGKPFSWTASGMGKHSPYATGTEIKLWTNASSYENLHDQDVRDGRPVKDDWARTVMIVMIFVSTSAFALIIFKFYDAKAKWKDRTQGI